MLGNESRRQQTLEGPLTKSIKATLIPEA